MIDYMNNPNNLAFTMLITIYYLFYSYCFAINLSHLTYILSPFKQLIDLESFKRFSRALFETITRFALLCFSLPHVEKLNVKH